VASPGPGESAPASPVSSSADLLDVLQELDAPPSPLT
jgi:hypothetical protein